jgi:putative ABC transport system substrate-binding protein
MRRRAFISLVGGAVAAWPVPTQSQQRPGPKRIGVLLNYSETNAEGQKCVTAFSETLHALGWVAGRDVDLILRWAAGNSASYTEYAADLGSRSLDVVLGATGASVVALQQATPRVPVVFVATIDPVGAGLVSSMSHPSGRTTGFTLYEYAISGKWLELLKEIAPDVRWAAVLRDPATASGIGQFAAIQTVAPAFGIELSTVDMRDTGAVERSVAALPRDSKGGLIVTASALGANKPREIAAIAERHQLPAVYPFGYFVEAGGLASYGPDLVDQYRRAAGYVDRILRGKNPADLPVQAPTRYELLINLSAAKALAIALPQTLLARADQLIE